MLIIVKVLILVLKLMCRRLKRHPKGDSNKSDERMKEFSNWVISPWEIRVTVQDKETHLSVVTRRWIGASHLFAATTYISVIAERGLRTCWRRSRTWVWSRGTRALPRGARWSPDAPSGRRAARALATCPPRRPPSRPPRSSDVASTCAPPASPTCATPSPSGSDAPVSKDCILFKWFSRSEYGTHNGEWKLINNHKSIRLDSTLDSRLTDWVRTVMYRHEWKQWHYQLHELALHEAVEENKSAAALEFQLRHLRVGERGERLSEWRVQTCVRIQFIERFLNNYRLSQ